MYITIQDVDGETEKVEEETSRQFSIVFYCLNVHLESIMYITIQDVDGETEKVEEETSRQFSIVFYCLNVHLCVGDCFMKFHSKLDYLRQMYMCAVWIYFPPVFTMFTLFLML